MADNNFITGLGKSLLSQGASSLLSGGISHFFNGLAQDRATQASKELMREQYAYQRQNNLDAMTLARQSKEKAGFNVNADGSFSPSVNPPQAGQTALGADINGNSLLSASQIEKSFADARLTNVEAELKERELKGKREADAIFGEGEFKTNSFVDEKGIWNFEVLKERNTKATTREGFEAVKELTTWLRKDLTAVKAEEAQNTLSRYVAQEQITNGALYALAKMPIEQFNLLVQEKAVQQALSTMYFRQGELFVAEKELKDLEKTIQENSNLGAIWEDISKDFKSGDVLGALGGILKGIFFAFMSIAGVNIGFSRGRVSSTSTSNTTSHSTVRSTSNNTSHSTVRHVNK